MIDRWTRLAVLLLLLAFTVQVLPPLVQKSGVCDEHGVHLPSGYVYWKTGVFSGGVNNPPLMQLLVAAPPALGGLDYSPFSNENIWAARLPVLVISLAMGLAVFAWARSLCGRAAGLAALFLFCFEPNVLAHSGLATLDLGVAAFTFGAFFFLWRASHSRRLFDRIAACIAMSLALLSKFTAIFVLPVFLILLLVALRRGGSVGSRVGRGAVALLLFAAIFIAVSHVVYHMPTSLGHYSSRNPHSPSRDVEPLSRELDPPSRDLDARVAGADESTVVRAGRMLLPNLYVDGALGKLRHSTGGHFAYLMGERSLRGWWYYFPVALALKTPIPFLAAFILSLVLGSGLKRWRTDYVFLLLPMICYIGAMAWVGVNIGVRHVLLFYPFAAVVGSALAAGGRARRRVLLALLVVGAVWHAAGTVRIHPHYLAYFNEIAGGPMGGPRYLIDSNIDWGQDEKLLAGFISEEPDTVLVNPGPFAPSVGTIAVNVNSIKGIFRGDDSGYGWLKQFDPERTLGYTWYVYRLKADDFSRSLSESDASAEPRFWRAIALQKEGRLEEGLSELRSIANEIPDLRVRAWRTAGRLLVQAARYEEGIEEFRKAAEVGDDPEARASLEAAMVKDKWSRGEAAADELMWLGRHYAERGDSRSAREALEAGVIMAPRDARHQLTMARFSGREGRFEEAVAYAEKAAELAPELAAARQLREEAKRLAAMENLDESFEARMTLAEIDSRYGRPASAARHYWRAFNLDPSSQDALTAMGEIIVRAKLGALKLETEWPSWEPSKR